MNGRRAPRSSSAALAIAAGSGPGRLPRRWAVRDRPSAGAVITSSGSSICTGPGRAPSKTAKARAITDGSSAGRSSLWLNTETPATSADWSGSSWSRPSPRPSSWLLLTLEITSIGTESARAWPIAVVMLVIPGPEMMKQAAGRPQARA